MHSHGFQHYRNAPSQRRYRCPRCRHVHVVNPSRSRVGEAVGRRWFDDRGRECIYLGIDHRFANSGGWQYVSRYEVMLALNRRLRSDEHAHHLDLNKSNNALTNLEVLYAEYHGRLHAFAATLAGYRDSLGRFVEYDEPGSPMAWPRWRYLLGMSAVE